MPKNKTVRRGKKRQAGHQPASNALIAIKKTEKDFLQGPTKLAALFNKEIRVHQQKVKKLTTALSQLQNLMKTTYNRMQAIQTKNTPLAKKQLNKNKKIHQEMIKAKTILDKQLQTTSELLEMAKNKQAKMLALSKYLNEFEKNWTKEAKKKSHATTKAKSLAKKKSAKIIPLVVEKPQLEVIQTETKENNPVKMEGMAQANSSS